MVMLLQPRSLQVLNLRPRDLLKKETTPSGMEKILSLPTCTTRQRTFYGNPLLLDVKGGSFQYRVVHQVLKEETFSTHLVLRNFCHRAFSSHCQRLFSSLFPIILFHLLNPIFTQVNNHTYSQTKIHNHTTVTYLQPQIYFHRSYNKHITTNENTSKIDATETKRGGQESRRSGLLPCACRHVGLSHAPPSWRCHKDR